MKKMFVLLSVAALIFAVYGVRNFIKVKEEKDFNYIVQLFGNAYQYDVLGGAYSISVYYDYRDKYYFKNIYQNNQGNLFAIDLIALEELEKCEYINYGSCLKALVEKINSPFLQYKYFIFLRENSDNSSAEKYLIMSAENNMLSKRILMNFYVKNNSDKLCDYTDQIKATYGNAFFYYLLSANYYDSFLLVQNKCNLFGSKTFTDSDISTMLDNINIKEDYKDLINIANLSNSSPSEAYELYKKRLESSDDFVSGTAAFCISRMYSDGEIVPVNNKKKIKFAKIAHNKGIQAASLVAYGRWEPITDLKFSITNMCFNRNITIEKDLN